MCAIVAISATGAAAAAAPPTPTPVDCRRVACVALTFDDGPGPHTQELLKTLAQEGAKATFYVVGRNVDAHPELVRQMVAQGHEVASHSYTHPQLTKLSDAQVRQQREQTDAALVKAIGTPAKTYRPPYRLHDPRVDAAYGLPAALWTLDTWDWKTRSVPSNIEVVSSASAGDIVLMHDIHEPTVQAMPEAIRALKARGVALVTVTELVNSLGVEHFTNRTAAVAQHSEARTAHGIRPRPPAHLPVLTGWGLAPTAKKRLGPIRTPQERRAARLPWQLV